MSRPVGGPSVEVRRRSTRALAIFALSCFLAPTLYLVTTVVLRLRQLPFAVTELVLFVPPLLFLALAVRSFVKRKHRPQVWPGAALTAVGSFFCGATVLVQVIRFDETIVVQFLALYGGPLLLLSVLATVLGGLAARVLQRPPIPELADTPFELTYRWRKSRDERITIRAEDIVVWQSYRVSTGEHNHTRTIGHSYLLHSIEQLRPVELRGEEDLRFAEPFRNRPRFSFGPGLWFVAGGRQWTIPIDAPEMIAELVHRRRMLAGQRERSS